LKKLPLDSFLLDGLQRRALLLDQSKELGVASTVEFLIDTGGLLLRMAMDWKD
jgi:hypothetical protein